MCAAHIKSVTSLVNTRGGLSSSRIFSRGRARKEENSRQQESIKLWLHVFVLATCSSDRVSVHFCRSVVELHVTRQMLVEGVKREMGGGNTKKEEKRDMEGFLLPLTTLSSD